MDQLSPPRDVGGEVTPGLSFQVLSRDVPVQYSYLAPFNQGGCVLFRVPAPGEALA